MIYWVESRNISLWTHSKIECISSICDQHSPSSYHSLPQESTVEKNGFAVIDTTSFTYPICCFILASSSPCPHCVTQKRSQTTCFLGVCLCILQTTNISTSITMVDNGQWGIEHGQLTQHHLFKILLNGMYWLIWAISETVCSVECEYPERKYLSLCHIESSVSRCYLYTVRTEKLVVACVLNVLKSDTASVSWHVMKLFIVTISNSEVSAVKPYHTIRIIICMHVHLPILFYQLISRLSKMQCAVAFWV